MSSPRPAVRTATLATLLALSAMPGARLAATAPAPPQQVTFESTVADLASPDPRVRLRAVQLLKGAGYAEAAVPLARIVNDSDDELQFEAIAAELNIFLAERIT